MATAEKLPTYKERLAKKKLELRRKGSSLAGWGKEKGHSVHQMYQLSRKSEPPAYGEVYEIALELGLIEGEQA